VARHFDVLHQCPWPGLLQQGQRAHADQAGQGAGQAQPPPTQGQAVAQAVLQLFLRDAQPCVPQRAQPLQRGRVVRTGGLAQADAVKSERPELFGWKVAAARAQVLAGVAQDVQALQALAIGRAPLQQVGTGAGAPVVQVQFADAGPEFPHAAGHQPGVAVQFLSGLHAALGVVQGAQIPALALQDGGQHLPDDRLIDLGLLPEGVQTRLALGQQGLFVWIGHVPGEVAQGRVQIWVALQGLQGVLQAVQQRQPVCHAWGGGVGHRVGDACQQVGQAHRFAHGAGQQPDRQTERARHPPKELTGVGRGRIHGRIVA